MTERYTISIKPVQRGWHDRVRHALRWGLPGRDEVMGLRAAHEFTKHGGTVGHTAVEEDAIAYATALEDAGAVVDIAIEPRNQ